MPFYPDEVTEVRLPAGVRADRAQRRRHKRQRRLATAAVLGLVAVALVVFPQARSWAHSIDVAVQPVCVEGKVYQDVTVNSQHGDYRFAGTASDTEGHSAPVAIPAGGASASVRLGPVSGAGSVHVVGDFWKANGDKAEHMDRTVGYRFLEDCKPPETTTTPTTSPPVDTQPPAKETPVVGPPDQHRTPTSGTPKEATPPVTAPPSGQLPFTGPERPFEMTDLQWATFLLGLGLFAGASALLWLAERRRFVLADDRRLVARATARAMAADARDARDPNILADMVARGRKVRDRLLSR